MAGGEGLDAARLIAAVVSTALVIVYAVGSGIWVSSDAGWYASLNRPPWQPPDVVFGLIWPYNFLALIAAGITVAVLGSVGQRTIWLVALAASIIAALLWARLFYVDHALTASGFALAAAVLCTIPLLVVAFRVQAWAGWILVPYIGWITVATTLAFGYATRN